MSVAIQSPGRSASSSWTRNSQARPNTADRSRAEASGQPYSRAGRVICMTAMKARSPHAVNQTQIVIASMPAKTACVAPAAWAAKPRSGRRFSNMT